MNKAPISKYEATGIFASIAMMALVLGFLRFNTGVTDVATVVEIEPDSQGAIVVAADDGRDGQSALADALVESSTNDGQLQNVVIDDILIGSGPKVEDGDTVTTHYIGSTQDGVQFDNSYLKGEPFTFTVGDGKVIAGWEKGLIGMQKGGQRILVIPPHMGYGDLEVGPIKAGSNLVFAVELLDIK